MVGKLGKCFLKRPGGYTPERAGHQQILENVQLGPDKLDRLSTSIDGKVSYELKHPFRDGTTHIPFSPEDFMARLASGRSLANALVIALQSAVVPRPRVNLTRYHGVFAPNSPFRKDIVPGAAKPACRKRKHTATSAPTESPVEPAQPTAPLTWAQRLKRVFEIDISVCPRCGGTLRVIADTTDPDVIRTILDHLKQRAPPPSLPRRATPSASTDDLFAAS